MDATIKRSDDGTVIFTFDDKFTDAMIESVKPLMQRYIDDAKEVEMERDRLSNEREIALAKNQTEFFKIQAEKQLEFSRLQQEAQINNLFNTCANSLYHNNFVTKRNS